MSSLATDTDVLIVGAGPVGLFLANEILLDKPVSQTSAGDSWRAGAQSGAPRGTGKSEVTALKENSTKQELRPAKSGVTAGLVE